MRNNDIEKARWYIPTWFAASSSNVRKDLAIKLVIHPDNTKQDEIIGKSLKLQNINFS
ncbi:unnamed protein product [Ilex paraguariensis]|uniref:Uncharacterized protein n=1 Tax=Ilex paraguariensis TaxID=185542 RepID=A0ABC8RFD4_9AQUA